MDKFEKIIAADGKSVRLQVSKLRPGQWFLEAIDRFGNSTPSHGSFKTHELAFEQAITAIQEKGIEIFIGNPAPQ